MNTELSEIAPTRYIWNEDNKVKYIENICSEECTMKIELLIEKLGEVQESERLEEVVNDVQCIILDAAKPCKKRPTNGNANRHTVKCSKWYDGECAEQRKLYVVSRNVYNRNRTDDAKAKREYMRSKYVKMCKQKARENERLETKEWNDNRFKNPRKYWKQISMKNPRDIDCVSLSHFEEHYISLYSQDVVNINNNEYSLYNVEVESLDRQFSVSEIEHAISHIKRGKASGDDQILSEFIYYGKKNLTQVLVDLFNMLYSIGYYPESWTTGIIVPIYKKGDRKIPGFNELAKQLHSEARADYLLWKASGKPRAGLLYLNMCQSRIRFKRTLKECRQNEESLRANAHAKSLFEKDMTSFWKDIKKNYDTRLPPAPMVDKCIGEKDICDMWQAHYKKLLNSVDSSKSKKSVERILYSIKDTAIVFRPVDIFNALKSTKTGKACGVDGLAAEHFIHASPIIHVYLSMLFNCFITHGYLPEDFMKTAIVPIIKNKTGDSSDKGNYRPIALVTACSKIFEICLLKMLETYLNTHDHQFGFKSQHATDMCIFTVKSVIKYYTKQNSSVFTCFLDAAKAFDRVSHWTLFSKLIQQNIPLVIVRIIAFWYQTQTMCIKWGKFNSMYFKVSNGVRQGGVLSPKLFAIYIDDLSQDLAMCKSGCYINEQCMNHVMYADDICLLAPSAIGLQRLLDVCFDFSISNDIMFNPIKSVCVVFKSKSNKLYCPTVSLDCDILEYTAHTKYLGFTFSMNAQDDDDMLRQMRTLYIRSNKLLRTFYHCSIDVKLELFRSFCTSFYCCYLWTAYKKSTFNKLRVAFNNAYRRVLGLPWRSSASAMYANFGIQNFEAVIRKSTFGFTQRLAKSTNSLIMAIESSWIVRIDIWDFWQKTLYIIAAT